MSVTVGSGRWQQMSRSADCLYLTQVRKGGISSLPTTSGGKPFQLWALGLFCTERNLAKRLRSNSFYPFTEQQPNGARGPLRGQEIRTGRARDAGRGGDLNGAEP